VAKTNFVHGTIVTPEWLNTIYGQDGGGHVHDGANADGHAPKINLETHTSGKIDLETQVKGVLPVSNVDTFYPLKLALEVEPNGPNIVSVASTPIRFYRLSLQPPAAHGGLVIVELPFTTLRITNPRDHFLISTIDKDILTDAYVWPSEKVQVPIAVDVNLNLGPSSITLHIYSLIFEYRSNAYRMLLEVPDGHDIPETTHDNDEITFTPVFLKYFTNNRPPTA